MRKWGILIVVTKSLSIHKFLNRRVYFIRQRLHIIDKECPKNYVLAYMLPSSSIYLERVNEILLDIQRFGFIHKWIIEMDFKALLMNMREFQSMQLQSKTLSLENLKFPFIVLICGSSFAVSLLFVEVIFHRMTNNSGKASKRYVATKTPSTAGLSLVG